MIAVVTSLPEMVTGASSVTIAGVPDIALGDALGSCTFNLLILAALACAGNPRQCLAARARPHTFGRVWVLALVIVMLALAEQARDAVPVVLHFSA